MAATLAQGRSLRESPTELKVEEEEATVLDFSNVSTFNASHVIHFTGFGSRGLQPSGANAKNGTPWYRLKHTSERGTADHEHFGGLVSTGDFNHDILEAHNVVRTYAGLAPLTWHDGLAAKANQRADELVRGGCYIRHTSTGRRMHEHGFYYLGENLYKVINMEPTGVDIVDAWYAEIEDYTYGRVGDSCVRGRCWHRSQPPCTVGHFTQVMWQSSSQIGCARRECYGQPKRTFVALCYYGEGGNIVGSEPFYSSHAQTLGVGSSTCR
jgi:uncharacterized protein YkwD